MADTKRDEFLKGTFPDGFMWGTATASYQIEGAYNEDGRGLSIWDTFCRTPGKVANGDTGDIACDSYHKIDSDVQLMKNLGLKHYRFSIAWPRIMPTGTTTVNQKGIDYYNKVINALLAAGITPMATLYHWDLPQPLQDKGGWPNPELADDFNEYARVCYKAFGDRVKFWITFNEPICTCWLGYGSGVHAPGIKDPIKSPFTSAHTLLRAHARAYHTYVNEFKSTQKGVCGITINADWSEPQDPANPQDVQAAERILQCKFGWFAQPIFGDGDYPDAMKKQLEKKCKELGMPQSALPQFTDAEKQLNKGSSDFFGLNHYTTRLIKHAEGLEPGSEAAICDAIESTDPSWDRGGSEWLYVVPWGLRRLLCWIKKTYNNPEIYITENGISDRKNAIEDTQRISYLKSYINECLKAVKLDGCDVRGYTCWSLLDNFEWAEGYDERFGLHFVDFKDPDRPRKPKASAKFYAQVIKDNGFP